MSSDGLDLSTMEDRPGIIMVVTLKNGLQLRHHVTDYTVSTDARTGEVTGLRWKPHPNASSELKAVNMDEVVAVATEHLQEFTVT